MLRGRLKWLEQAEGAVTHTGEVLVPFVTSHAHLLSPQKKLNTHLNKQMARLFS